LGAIYVYYDFVTGKWVNTGHRSESADAINIGAGDGYIFNLVRESAKGRSKLNAKKSILLILYVLKVMLLIGTTFSF